MKVQYYRIFKSLKGYYWLTIHLRGEGFWGFFKRDKILLGPFDNRREVDAAMEDDMFERNPDLLMWEERFTPTGKRYL